MSVARNWSDCWDLCSGCLCKHTFTAWYHTGLCHLWKLHLMLTSSFRLTAKKTPNLCITGPLQGESTVEELVMKKVFPCHDVNYPQNPLWMPVNRYVDINGIHSMCIYISICTLYTTSMYFSPDASTLSGHCVIQVLNDIWLFSWFYNVIILSYFIHCYRVLWFWKARENDVWNTKKP